MDNQVLITILILILVGVLFTVAYINSKRIPERKRAKLFEKLEELEMQIKSTEIFARRDAVIRLDNLLGRAFNIRYGNNDSCGDNLKLSRKQFDKELYQKLWDVHKIRNEIVHNDRDITSVEAEEIFHIYKLGIKHILR